MAKLDIGPICHEHLLSPFSHHIHIPAKAGGTSGQGGGGGLKSPFLNFYKLVTRLVKLIQMSPQDGRWHYILNQLTVTKTIEES